MTSQNIVTTNISSDEYIDLIDVLAFFWKSRIFTITGILMGLIGGWVVTTVRKPPIFVSTLPVILESVEPVNQDSAIAIFNDVVSQRDTAGELYDELIKIPDPKIKEALESQELTRELFVSFQSANVGPIPLRLYKGDHEGTYVAETRFRSSDKGAVLMAGLIQAAHEVLVAKNRKNLKVRPVFDEKMVKELSGAESQFLEISKIRMTEESASRLGLYQLEAQLAKKLGKQSDSIQRKGDSDQIMRLLGELLYEEKISDSEAQEIEARRINLMARLEMVRTKYSQATRDAESAIKLFSDNLLRRSSGSAEQIPMIASDVSTGSYKFKGPAIERYESKRPYFLFLGILVGGGLGLFLFALKSFLSENRERIRGIFVR